jgi:hypothetical protein
VARIEASNATFRKHLEEDCIPNYFQQQRDSAVARVRQLEEQHVAAVAMLKSISVNRGDEHDYAVDALIGIERSLAVLDAEETT